nr:serine/arginine repetitive matrix protein 1-like [Aegilops tauschii subsp. strangulata]
MTGLHLHDERATSEPRRSKRSRPEATAAEPPARRTKRAEGQVPLRKRESPRFARPPRPLDSDSESAVASPPPPAPPARGAETPAPPPKRQAERVSRPSSPPPGHRDSEDVAVAPPPARRVKAPAPPPKTEWHRISYRLRNRVVQDTGNLKPAPSRHDNGFSASVLLYVIIPSSVNSIEIKHDLTWQTPTCPRVALEHYNDMNQVIPKTLVVVACAMRISCILLGVDTTVPNLDLFDMLLVAYRFHSSSECWKR